MYQHKLDSCGRAAVLGTSREDQFEATCIKNEWKYERATRETDPKFQDARREHWDFIVNSQTVDIKAMKRFHRWDDIQEKNYICLELKGGGWKGNSGWLQGKASAIAFEYGDEWLIFGRDELFKWIIHEMNVKTRKPTVFDAPTGTPELYKLYRRTSDKFEIFCWVPLADFLHLRHAKVEK